MPSSYDPSVIDMLTAALPEQFHPDIPVLAQVLSAARDGVPTSVATENLQNALRTLRGKTLNIQGDNITVGNISGEGIAIGRGAQATVIRIYVPQTPEQKHAWRNRNAMLEKVRNYWVTGFLHQSLHNLALIELGMQYHPDALRSPWQMIVQPPDRLRKAVPANKSIADVFDSFSGEVLILGSPGSGKTTMLLDLARILIERAQQDETLAIPVVFNLSSWATGHSQLDVWLLEELEVRYQVPRKVGQVWIDHDQLLPLLDGLDEVQPKDRDACVQAINIFHRGHGLAGLVVCSRIADYDLLNTQFQLQGAVVLQTLSDQQITAALESIGDTVGAAHAVLRQMQTTAQQSNDAEAQALMRTPLILSITMLAYQGTASAPLPPDATPTDQQRHLFATYVTRMLERRGLRLDYPPAQTIRWLAWLAVGMVAQGQTIFYLEKIQPEGTLSRAQQQCFDRIVGVMRGILVGVAVGSVVSVMIALAAFVWADFLRMVGFTGALLLVIGSIGLFSLFYAVVGFVAAGRRSASERIDLVEELSWTKAGMNRALRYGIGFGSMATIASVLSYGWIGLIPGLATGIALWALVLSKAVVADESEVRARPNQGIWTSARNALRLSIIVTLSLGLSIGFNLNVGIDSPISALVGTFVGLGVGLFAALFYGAETYFKHFLLRAMLYRQGRIPRNYIDFLDYGANRILLRRIGGGYIFVHRLLMGYFASLDTESDDSPS